MTVALFTLGGTISMAGRSAGDEGVVTRLTGADLVAHVPGLAEAGAEVEVHDVQAVPSASLSFAQVLDVVDAAGRAVASGATGVVVTQGTDTLEETAYLVDLVWPHDEPFVVTGAMRNPTLAGADGPANLLAAVRVAAAVEARGLGALVVLNDAIHLARWVRKRHSTSVAAFGSADVGPVGYVHEGHVRILARAPRPQPLQVPDEGALRETRVALYTVSLDDDGLLLDRCHETHHGLVVAALGVGHVPRWLAERFGDVATHIPVVLTSRTGGGPVLRATYAGVGAEIDLQRRGLVNGGLLGPPQARVLLRMLLAAGATPSQVVDAFETRGALEWGASPS